MAYNVNALPAYVQENHDLLVKNFALIGDPKGTRSRISIQTGVKKNAYLNILSLSPVLQSGEACGFSASGDAVLSQRTIETANIKVNMEFCEKTLLGKYAEYLVKVNAVDNPFPFEEYITTALTDELNKKIEKLIWQGDTDMTSSDPDYADLHWIDGFNKIIGGTGEDVSGDENSAYEAIMSVYLNLPEEVLEQGAEIYISPAGFRSFMQTMVQMNYFNYNPGNAEFGEFILPGTDAKVVRTQGLAGSRMVTGTFAKNLVYGCDMENDEEKFDIWFSQDNRTWRVAVEWNSGVQVAFPDMCVFSGWNPAYAGMYPASSAASLSKIASAVNTDNQIETHPNE